MGDDKSESYEGVALIHLELHTRSAERQVVHDQFGE
jgi:hypothetical protein